MGAARATYATGRLRWLCAAALWPLGFGLFFWQKAVLVLPVLGALAVGWFAEGGPLRAARHPRSHPLASVVAGGLLGVAYTAAYWP